MTAKRKRPLFSSSFLCFERRIRKNRRIKKLKRIKKSNFLDCWDENPNKACLYCSCKPDTVAQDTESSTSSSEDEEERNASTSQLELVAVPPDPLFRAMRIKAAELDAYSRHPNCDRNEVKVQEDVRRSVAEEIRRQNQARHAALLAKRLSLPVDDNRYLKVFDPDGFEKKYVEETTWLKLGRGLLDFVKEGGMKKKKSRTKDGDKKCMAVKLTGVSIFPRLPGREGEIGTLEAHSDRFVYKTSSSYLQSHLTFGYENVKDALTHAEDEREKMGPLLHFRLRHPIKVGTEKREHLQFHLVLPASELDIHMVLHPTPEEREKQIRDTSPRKILKDFVAGVIDKWKGSRHPFPFRGVCKWMEFHGVVPPKKEPNIFFLTFSSLLQLVNSPFTVVNPEEIEIVNLARLRPDEVDMTVVLRNFNCPVIRICSIPLESLENIKICLDFWGVKFYDNNVDLDWNLIVKKIADNMETFIREGGWDAYALEDKATSLCYRVYHLEVSRAARMKSC